MVFFSPEVGVLGEVRLGTAQVILGRVDGDGRVESVSRSGLVQLLLGGLIFFELLYLLGCELSSLFLVFDCAAAAVFCIFFALEVRLFLQLD